MLITLLSSIKDKQPIIVFSIELVVIKFLFLQKNEEWD